MTHLRKYLNTHIRTPNIWGGGAPELEFTNAGATLSPTIQVTGTPEILWTWSDGTTDNVANPGEKTLTGTHTLLVTPWSAVTRILFNGDGLTGPFETKEWENIEHLVLYENANTGKFVTYAWEDIKYLWIFDNDFDGELVTHPWENMLEMWMYGLDVTGNFAFHPWVNLIKLYLQGNNHSSVSGSLQTQIKMTVLYLSGNNVSSQVEIDKVYSDLLVNAADAGRVSVCTVNTSGANMSAPSAAGIADAATLVTTYGWTVTHA